MQRLYVALHAMAPAALVVAVLVHFWGPAWLPMLAQRPVWTVWVLLGLWLLMSALAAAALRSLAVWRMALGSTGALLLSAGGVGVAVGAALAPAMLMGMAALGLVCVALAAFIGPARVQPPKRKVVRHGATAGSAHPTHPTHHRPARRSGVVRWLPAAAHQPFWLAGLLAVESFRLAHIVATEPARSSGMLGLLLAFFVALPAATLRAWAPRSAALLWALAALAYGGLAAKAGLAQWVVAATLCAAAACSSTGLLHRMRRGLRRATVTAPATPQSTQHSHQREAT